MPTYPSRPSANYVTNDSLGSSATFYAPLSEGTGFPHDLLSSTAATFHDNSGSTTDPTWSTGEFGSCLSFASTDREVSFANCGISTRPTTMTLFALLKKTASGAGDVGMIPITSNNVYMYVFDNNSIVYFNWNFANFNPGLPAIPLNHNVGIVLSVAPNPTNALITGYFYDYDAASPSVVTSSVDLGYPLDAAGVSSGGDVIVNSRTFSCAMIGNVYTAGVLSRAWSSGEAAAFFADPFKIGRAAITSSPTHLVNGSTGVSVSLTGNSAFYSSGTPGSPTFSVTPSGQTSNGSKTSQSVSGSNAATVVVSAGTGGSLVFGDGRATVALTVGAATATGFSLTGPSTSTAHVASTNFTVSLTGGADSTSTVYNLTSSNVNDILTPSSLTMGGGTAAATFTVTAFDSGSRTITATMATNPDGFSTTTHSVTLTASAGSLTAGGITVTGSTWSSVALSVSASSGGSGAITVEIHRSTTQGFTPVTGTRLTSTTPGSFPYAYTDSTATARQVYYYKAKYLDASSNTATSVQAAAMPISIPFGRVGIFRCGQSHTGFISDYLTDLTGTHPDLFGTCHDINAGVSGTTSTQWVDTYLASAVTSAQSTWSGTGLDIVIVTFEFGVNDANQSISNDTSVSNLNSMIAYIESHKIKAGVPHIYVIHGTIPPTVGGSLGPSVFATCLGYNSAVSSLENGTNIFFGGTDVTGVLINNPGYYEGTGVHVSQTPAGKSETGYEVVGKLQSVDVLKALERYRTTASTTGGTGPTNYGY